MSCLNWRFELKQKLLFANQTKRRIFFLREMTLPEKRFDFLVKCFFREIKCCVFWPAYRGFALRSLVKNHLFQHFNVFFHLFLPQMYNRKVFSVDLVCKEELNLMLYFPKCTHDITQVLPFYAGWIKKHVCYYHYVT